MDIEISPHGHCTVINVSGEVDLFYSSKLREAIINQLDQGHNVAVELSKVNYIDSSGVASLVEGFQFAKAKNQPFTLVAISPPVMQVLQLARLDQVIPHVNAIEEIQA